MGCKLVQKYYKYAHDYVDEKKNSKKMPFHSSLLGNQVWNFVRRVSYGTLRYPI
jgi:hypothetical protein